MDGVQKGFHTISKMFELNVELKKFWKQDSIAYTNVI